VAGSLVSEWLTFVHESYKLSEYVDRPGLHGIATFVQTGSRSALHHRPLRSMPGRVMYLCKAKILDKLSIRRSSPLIYIYYPSSTFVFVL
jgi:hypothetical protein